MGDPTQQLGRLSKGNLSPLARPLAIVFIHNALFFGKAICSQGLGSSLSHFT